METTEKKEIRLEGFLTKDPQTHKAGDREFASFSIGYNTSDGAIFKFCQVENKAQSDKIGDIDPLFTKALGLKKGEKVTIHGHYDSYTKNGKTNEYVVVSALDYHKKLENETVKIESISEIKPKEKNIINIQAKDKDGNFIKFSTYDDSPIYEKIKEAKLEPGDSILINADVQMRQVETTVTENNEEKKVNKTYQNGKLLSLDNVFRKELSQEKSDQSEKNSVSENEKTAKSKSKETEVKKEKKKKDPGMEP